VPVIGHYNNNGIDILIIEQLAVVHVFGDLFVPVLELPGLDIKKLSVRVAKRDYANTGDSGKYVEMLPALFLQAHNCQANVVVCPADSRRRAESDTGGSRQVPARIAVS
jgi:hypothetical protein